MQSWQGYHRFKYVSSNFSYITDLDCVTWKQNQFLFGTFCVVCESQNMCKKFSYKDEGYHPSANLKYFRKKYEKYYIRHKNRRIICVNCIYKLLNL
jgi:hypothetical protein